MTSPENEHLRDEHEPMPTTENVTLIDEPAEESQPYAEPGIGVVVDGHHRGHAQARTAAAQYLADEGIENAELLAERADVVRLWRVEGADGSPQGYNREPRSGGRPVSAVVVALPATLPEPSRSPDPDPGAPDTRDSQPFEAQAGDEQDGQAATEAAEGGSASKSKTRAR